MSTSRKKFKIERRLNFGEEHNAQSMGGLSRVMAQPDWSSIPGQVKDAQDLGYDVLLSAETPGDPYLPLVIASGVPGDITLGTGIAVALARSPVSTAYTAWELQRMSGGRFMLGLGSQVKAHITRRFSMPWSPPAPRMREYVQVVKACWNNWQNNVPVAFEGESYQVNLMSPAVQLPPQANPHIPVQLAAVGDFMLRAAGEVCDGVRLHDFASKKYIEEVALTNLRIGFDRAERPAAEWEKFEITGGGMIVTAATADELAIRVIELRKRLAFYASTPAYRVQMDLEGFGEQAEMLTRLSKENRWDEMLEVFTEEMADRYAAIGTYDVIVDRIRDHFAQCTAVQLTLPINSDADRAALKGLIQDLKS